MLPPPVRFAVVEDNGSAEQRRWRILVADDHADHLDMIVRSIKRSQHGDAIELIAAEDGDLAWAEIVRGVDAAFLDIKMPGRSGLQLLQAIRTDQRFSELPVVIVSSSSDPWDTRAAEEYGALTHIEKGRYDIFRETVADAVGMAVDVLQARVKASS